MFILKVLYWLLSTPHWWLSIFTASETSRQILPRSEATLLIFGSFLLSFFFSSRNVCLSPDSAVWRLHPRKLRHHPVTWIPGLLPPQPELHLGNRDLPRQRLAGELGVDTCSSQIQFPSRSYTPAPPFPPVTERPFGSRQTSCLLETGALTDWLRAAMHRMPPHTCHLSKCNHVNLTQQLYLSDAHWSATSHLRTEGKSSQFA